MSRHTHDGVVLVERRVGREENLQVSRILPDLVEQKVALRERSVLACSLAALLGADCLFVWGGGWLSDNGQFVVCLLTNPAKASKRVRHFE